jgi:hypothetical protein
MANDDDNAGAGSDREGEDHNVPADLVEVHEAVEWTAAVERGPNP